MADRKMKFTLDFLAKTAGLKDAGDLLDRLGDELDDSVDGGKRLTAAMRLAADHIEADLAQTRAMAQRLGEALGPELSASMGSARLDQFAANLRQAGMSADQLDENIDDVADAVRRMDAASASVDNFDGSMRRAADTTDRTGSVVANFAGNAAQELPVVSGAMGPLNVAIGQFAEYAAEGDIKLSSLAKQAGPLLGVAVALAYANNQLDLLKAKDAFRSELVESYGDVIDEAGDAVANLSAHLREAGKVAVTTWGNAANPWADATKDITAGLLEAGLTVDQFAELVEGGTPKIRAWVDAQQAAGHAIPLDVMRALNEHMTAYDAAVEAGATSAAFFARTQADVNEAVGEFVRKKDPIAQFTAEFNRMAAAMAADVAPSVNDVDTVAKGLNITTEEAIDLAAEYADTLRDKEAAAADQVTQAVRSADEALQEYRDTLLDAIDDTYDYESASIDLADSVADLAAKQAEVDAILADSSKTDAEKAAALRDLRRQQISTAEGALETARAFAASKGATDGSITSARLQIEELRRQKELFPELAGVIDGYIAKLRAIPGVINTSVAINGGSMPGTTPTGGGGKYDPRVESVQGGRSGLNLTINVTPGGSGTPADYGAAVADAITRW